MAIPTNRVYGFGERESGFALGEGAWSMWAQAAEAEYDDGHGGKQLAGMHPFVLIKANKSDEFLGLFFRNSNAQSPIVSYNSDQDKWILSYITTGSNIDITFFFRGSAKEIIQQYQDFIGHPRMPPFWALGWHASSNAWSNLTAV